jgi:hypothetical protein
MRFVNVLYRQIGRLSGSGFTDAADKMIDAAGKHLGESGYRSSAQHLRCYVPVYYRPGSRSN